MCLIHRGHTWMTSTKYRRFRAPLPLCPYIFQCFPIFITLPSTFWQNPPPPPCVDVNYVCSLIQNAIEYLIFFCEFKVPQIVLNLVYCTKMNSLCELLGPQNESLLHYLANTRLLQRKFRTISPPQKGRSKNRNWNYYINPILDGLLRDITGCHLKLPFSHLTTTNDRAIILISSETTW